MHLTRLLYYSYAYPGLNNSDIYTIIKQSNEQNASVSITGMLLHFDDLFVQLMEGPRMPLSRTFNRIIADKRHTAVTLIEATQTERRIFPGESMGLVATNPDVVEIIRAYSGGPSFDPEAMDAMDFIGMMRALRHETVALVG